MKARKVIKIEGKFWEIRFKQMAIYGRWIPLWAILDILLAFILMYPAAKMGKNLFQENARHLPLSVILISFVGTVTDALTQVFLLIPAGLCMFFGWPPEGVYYVFVAGAVDSYIEDALVVATSFLVDIPLLMALQKILGIKLPLSCKQPRLKTVHFITYLSPLV